MYMYRGRDLDSDGDEDGEIIDLEARKVQEILVTVHCWLTFCSPVACPVIRGCSTSSATTQSWSKRERKEQEEVSHI